MENNFFKELKTVDTEKIMVDLTNEFRSKTFSPLYATYAATYVIAKSAICKQVDISSLDSFVSSCNVDENIIYFIKDKLNKMWDIVDRISKRYDANVFIALLLFNDSYEMRSFADGTPIQISKLACKILKINDGEKVADYCTGQGSFIIESISSNENADYYGNECALDKASVALMRADLLGMNIKIEVKNTFSLDMNEFSFDKIFSNYPFAVRLSENETYGNNALQYLNTYLPSRKKTASSDWLFNTVIINTLKETGKAVVIVTPNSLFNLSDKDIRQFFVEKGYIESIVALPSKLFETTSISTYLVVLSYGNEKVKFVDARECYASGRRVNELSDDNIAEIMNMLELETKKSKNISKNDIAKNDYNLDAAKYFAKEIPVKDSVKFGDIIKNVTRGAQLKASDLDSIATSIPTPYQYIMLSDIQDGMISDSLTYITEITDNLKKYCVYDKNILISKCGTPVKVAIANIAENATVLANGNLYIVEIDETKANPYFIKAFFDSELGKTILNSSSVGTAITTISLEALKNVSVPCPDLEKQNEIAVKYLAAKDELALAKLSVRKLEDKIRNIYEESVGD